MSGCSKSQVSCLIPACDSADSPFISPSSDDPVPVCPLRPAGALPDAGVNHVLSTPSRRLVPTPASAHTAPSRRTRFRAGVPERAVNSGGQGQRLAHHSASGPRNCLGVSLRMQEMRRTVPRAGGRESQAVLPGRAARGRGSPTRQGWGAGPDPGAGLSAVCLLCTPRSQTTCVWSRLHRLTGCVPFPAQVSVPIVRS